MATTSAFGALARRWAQVAPRRVARRARSERRRDRHALHYGVLAADLDGGDRHRDRGQGRREAQRRGAGVDCPRACTGRRSAASTRSRSRNVHADDDDETKGGRSTSRRSAMQDPHSKKKPVEEKTRTATIAARPTMRRRSPRPSRWHRRASSATTWFWSVETASVESASRFCGSRSAPRRARYSSAAPIRSSRSRRASRRGGSRSSAASSRPRCAAAITANSARCFAGRRLNSSFEIGVAAGAEIANGAGPAGALALRFRPGWHLPARLVLRYDGAVLYRDGGHATEQVLTLGVEWRF